MRLDEYWYKKSALSWLLAPLSWLYCAVAALRRRAYRSGVLTVHDFPVPVIVVGNITVGGSGKTPLVVWVVDLLRQAGFRPGIVSRGYRGQARNWPQQVRPDSDPAAVGDEPVLLARRCRCPVAVGPGRVAAVRALLQHSDCNVVVSDDGLQHYAMGRDIEVAVVDGIRRFGNNRCLPAGPLRERRGRLRQVDFVVSNGVAGRLEYPMKLTGREARSLQDDGRTCKLDALRGAPVHAVAGIGYPARFFGYLRQFGLQVMEHPFPDHHRFQARDLRFEDGHAVLMTEKDAVKCRRFAACDYWYVPVTADLDARFGQRLLSLLQDRLNERRAGGSAGAEEC